MLGDIRSCILATDLALFFGNKAKLKDIADKNEIMWDDVEHRYTLYKRHAYLFLGHCLEKKTI